MCPCTTIETIDVRPFANRIRTALILGNTARLTQEQAFLFVDDHDPKPLFYQIANGLPGAFRWDYPAQGPEVRQIRITRIGA